MPETAPASSAQQQFWLLEQLASSPAEYAIPLAWRLRGPISPVAMETALSFLAQRHETLRTALVMTDVGVQRCIAPITEVEVRTLAESADGRPSVQLAAALVRRLLDKPFDLSSGDVLRAGLHIR